MEKAFYFENEGKRLFAILHSPKNSNGRKGIILCHPYGEEKQASYRVFVRFARELCNKGFYILRFDCFGYGDSQGDFEDATVETKIADTIKAIDLMKTQINIERVGLLGLRLGGTVASLVAERDSRVETLILWSPIINGREYIDELIRNKLFSDIISKVARKTHGQIIEELKSKGFVDIDGHCLTLDIYEQLTGIDLTTQVLNFSGPVFISTMEETPQLHRPFETLSEVYKKKGALSEIKIVDEKPIWDLRPLLEWYFPEHLNRETLKWIIGSL